MLSDIRKQGSLYMFFKFKWKYQKAGISPCLLLLLFVVINRPHMALSILYDSGFVIAMRRSECEKRGSAKCGLSNFSYFACK